MGFDKYDMHPSLGVPYRIVSLYQLNSIMFIFAVHIWTSLVRVHTVVCARRENFVVAVVSMQNINGSWCHALSLQEHKQIRELEQYPEDGRDREVCLGLQLFSPPTVSTGYIYRWGHGAHEDFSGQNPMSKSSSPK